MPAEDEALARLHEKRSAEEEDRKGRAIAERRLRRLIEAWDKVSDLSGFAFLHEGNRDQSDYPTWVATKLCKLGAVIKSDGWAINFTPRDDIQILADSILRAAAAGNADRIAKCVSGAAKELESILACLHREVRTAVLRGSESGLTPEPITIRQMVSLAPSYLRESTIKRTWLPNDEDRPQAIGKLGKEDQFDYQDLRRYLIRKSPQVESILPATYEAALSELISKVSSNEG